MCGEQAPPQSTLTANKEDGGRGVAPKLQVKFCAQAHLVIKNSVVEMFFRFPSFSNEASGRKDIHTKNFQTSGRSYFVVNLA